MNGPQLAAGFFLALLVAGLAYSARALSVSGSLAAIGVGTLTFGIGGMVPAILLLLFFISSSALSRAGGSRKRAFAAAFAKGGRRDYAQVLANGLLAAVFAALYGLTSRAGWLAALTGALAAVNADTWATEIGVLAGRRPRLILDGAEVEVGTSGAVSTVGVTAAAGGAALIAVTAGAFVGDGRMIVAAIVGGMGGALFDSLLGATVQAIYRCPRCDKETERHPRHTCGETTVLVRCWAWLGNDGVNFAASAAGAALSVLLWRLF